MNNKITMETTLAGVDVQGAESLKTIYERRAVRKYLDRAVDNDLIEKILGAGRMAPSAMNKQGWKFYILTRRETIFAFSEAIEQVVKPLFAKSLTEKISDLLFHRESRLEHLKDEDVIFHGAPVVIFITSAKNDEWAGLDTGMCAQNMMLAAKALGLDTCPVGLAKFVEQTPIYYQLEVPDTEKVQLAITLGYGNESPELHRMEKNDTIFIDRMECC
ncbi:MAG: nitroreductase family protein [Mucilaginibacter sp.]